MIMKKHIWILLLVAVPFFLFAQEEDMSIDYTMWQTMYMKPDFSKVPELSEALAKHNKTYHNTPPHLAIVYRIASGPNTGKLMMIMGPGTFSDLDNLGGEEHFKDWTGNVMPHLKAMEQGEFWKMDDELSTVEPPSPENPPFKLLMVRYHTIKDGQSDQMKGVFEKISATLKQMENARPWALFYNEFWQGDIGRHIATVSYYDSWSQLDENLNFQEAYEKTHGEGSWAGFEDEFTSVIDDSWDEIWVYMPQLSGTE